MLKLIQTVFFTFSTNCRMMMMTTMMMMTVSQTVLACKFSFANRVCSLHGMMFQPLWFILWFTQYNNLNILMTCLNTAIIIDFCHVTLKFLGNIVSLMALVHNNNGQCKISLMRGGNPYISPPRGGATSDQMITKLGRVGEPQTCSGRSIGFLLEGKSYLPRASTVAQDE